MTIYKYYINAFYVFTFAHSPVACNIFAGKEPIKRDEERKRERIVNALLFGLKLQVVVVILCLEWIVSSGTSAK
ncbi:hypothetical protein VIGAN_04393000 [Vigna angularis var. angularis]|uniref:Uncharacterized protein n=1 Tax=Vigna angularis var. angularis TaxID=157739 RepID=A0A0S3S0F4_PHAAN|nr:hypothetical protein VIGAN_04393000 [Vigna angularis var. angularis]